MVYKVKDIIGETVTFEVEPYRIDGHEIFFRRWGNMPHEVSWYVDGEVVETERVETFFDDLLDAIRFSRDFDGEDILFTLSEEVCDDIKEYFSWAYAKLPTADGHHQYWYQDKTKNRLRELYNDEKQVCRRAKYLSWRLEHNPSATDKNSKWEPYRPLKGIKPEERFTIVNFGGCYRVMDREGIYDFPYTTHSMAKYELDNLKYSVEEVKNLNFIC